MDQLVIRESRRSSRPTTIASGAGLLAAALAAALTAAVLVLTPASALAASTFSFAGKVAYATGGAPQSVAVADLTGDGKPDVVTADSGQNAVSVLINQGDGTLQPHVEYTTGEAPVAVAVRDLNGDGKADIVVANSTSNSVSVLINKGDGTFETQVEYETAAHPVAVALVDLTGDGKPDIVTADEDENAISVFVNKGDGTFEPQAEYATGSEPTGIALADVNGDGKQDAIAANSGGSSVSVLLGKGDGTFEAQTEFPTGEAPVAVAAGDVNGDGKQDIVAADSDANKVSVLLGKGDGTFAAKQDFETGTKPHSVALTDLNADGKQDIVAADSGANTASLLLGKGDGTFAAKQDFETGAAPQAVALGDLNGDGKPDIVTADLADETASVLLNSSVGALEASPSKLSFAPLLFGSKSPAQKVTVTNTGSAALTISAVTVGGKAAKSFASSGCSSSTLAAGASCALSITVSPKEYGSLKGEVTVSSTAGSKVIALSGEGLPPLPTATTEPATEIVGSYVTLTGKVVSQGPGSFYFQYGTSTAYGSVTPTLPLASSTNPQVLAATLPLTPGTTYHYRIVATNLAGTTNGADQAFTIPPEAPSVKVLKHGRLAKVLKRGLRLRVSDTSAGFITLKVYVDAGTARNAHLIPAKSKRKGRVSVGTLRVSIAANKGKNVTVRFSHSAKRHLATLGTVKLTVVGLPATANRAVGETTTVSTKVRR